MSSAGSRQAFAQGSALALFLAPLAREKKERCYKPLASLLWGFTFASSRGSPGDSLTRFVESAAHREDSHSSGSPGAPRMGHRLWEQQFVREATLGT